MLYRLKCKDKPRTPLKGLLPGALDLGGRTGLINIINGVRVEGFEATLPHLASLLNGERPSHIHAHAGRSLMILRDVAIRCGRQSQVLSLPQEVNLLEMRDLPPLPQPEEAVRESLRSPIQSPPLKDLAQGKKSACVVVSDITRPVPNPVILPPLLQTLEEGGIPREGITLLIATGMHRPNLGEELMALLGPEIPRRYRVVNHYCRRPEVYRRIHEIDGAPIEINVNYLDAELKLLTGLIEPHFYAGYSGGCKAILPGISSFETMKFMHSYEMIAHPKVTNCVLEGNPFHEYGIQVARIGGVDFITNVVINKERKLAGVFSGHFDAAHLAGCDMVRRHSVVPVPEPLDLVITSGGGYPLDATFYQISKALVCAKNILRPRGIIVVVCECREGLGSPEFCSVLRSACTWEDFVKGYADPKDFVIDQWCAQSIHQALAHAGEVLVYSPGLARHDLEPLGIRKIDDLQATVERLLETHPKAAVIPEGPYVVGMLP